MLLVATDPVLDRSSAEAYLRGQTEAYLVHKIEEAQVKTWLDAPTGSVRLVTARDSENNLAAGIRIHVRESGFSLATETRLSHPLLNELLDIADLLTVVELAGLWVSPRHQKSGVADMMFLSAVALARSLGADVTCGCAHEKSIPICQKYGMSFDRIRAFPYPDERYRTHVGIVDLAFADRFDHPARGRYGQLCRVLSTRGTSNFEFDPEEPKEWNCSFAPDLDWSLPPISSNALRLYYSAFPQHTTRDSEILVSNR